mgnify:CR=1 FL=1
MNTFLIDKKPKVLTTFSSNQATKVINATAKITPGIAYPEIDKVDKKLKLYFWKLYFHN